jgi:hypothetical protein
VKQILLVTVCVLGLCCQGDRLKAEMLAYVPDELVGSWCQIDAGQYVRTEEECKTYPAHLTIDDNGFGISHDSCVVRSMKARKRTTIRRGFYAAAEVVCTIKKMSITSFSTATP